MKLKFAAVVLVVSVVSGPASAWDHRQKTYSLSWKEYPDQIIDSTVCAQYSPRTVDYRDCRRYALQYFTDACGQHTTAYNRAGPSNKASERDKMHKYCREARQLP